MLKDVGIGLFLLTALCNLAHAKGTTIFDGLEVVFIDCSIDTGSITNPIDIQRDAMVCRALADDFRNNWLGKEIDSSTPWIVTIGLQKYSFYKTHMESLKEECQRLRSRPWYCTAQELKRRKAYADLGAVLPMYVEGTDKKFLDIYLGMSEAGGRQYIGLENSYLQIFANAPRSPPSGPPTLGLDVTLIKRMPDDNWGFSWKWSPPLCRRVMFERCSMNEDAGIEFFPPATDSDFINLARAQMSEQLRYMTTQEFEKKLAKQMEDS